MILLSTKAPVSVQLFRAGKNETTKGTFVWSERSVREVAAQWSKHARDFGFDFEHSTFDSSVSPKDREAAGWGKLEARQEGLFVVGIQWTADAAKLIAEKKFRYLSPVPQIDDTTGEIVGCLNCALTNLPATHGAAALLSASPKKGRAMTEIKKQLYTALRLLLSTAQLAAESKDAEEAEMGKELAGVAAPKLTLLQDQGVTDEGDTLEDLLALSATVRTETGAKKGLSGAVMALNQKAKLAGVHDEKEGLFAKILLAGKAREDQKPTLLKKSVADLETYLEQAPKIVPTDPPLKIPVLSSKPASTETAGEDEDADEMFARARR